MFWICCCFMKNWEIGSGCGNILTAGCLVKTSVQNIIGVLLSQRDAGEMAALTWLLTITGRARGHSVPSNTNGGNETARRSSLGQEKKKQAQRNVKKHKTWHSFPLDARRRQQHQPQAHLSLWHHLYNQTQHFTAPQVNIYCLFKNIPCFHFIYIKHFSPHKISIK